MLILMAITYMETAGGENNGTMCDETLATITSPLSHAPPCDTQNTLPSETRKWKKKDRHREAHLGPILEEDGHAIKNLVRQKRQRLSSRGDEITTRRKCSKGQITDSTCTTAEAEGQPHKVQ